MPMTKSRFVALFLLVALALQGCTEEANDGVVKGPHALPTDLGADGKFGNYISSNAQEYELKGTAHVFSPTASQRRPPKSSLRSSTSWSSLFLHTPGHLAELAPSWVGPTDEASALPASTSPPRCRRASRDRRGGSQRPRFSKLTASAPWARLPARVVLFCAQRARRPSRDCGHVRRRFPVRVLATASLALVKLEAALNQCYIEIPSNYG